VPSGTIFALDDPEVGIEADLACEVGFDLRLGGGHRLEGGADTPTRQGKSNGSFY
jgi:hypothetical protein